MHRHACTRMLTGPEPPSQAAGANRRRGRGWSQRPQPFPSLASRPGSRLQHKEAAWRGSHVSRDTSPRWPGDPRCQLSGGSDAHALTPHSCGPRGPGAAVRAAGACVPFRRSADHQSAGPKGKSPGLLNSLDVAAREPALGVWEIAPRVLQAQCGFLGRARA